MILFSFKNSLSGMSIMTMIIIIVIEMIKLVVLKCVISRNRSITQVKHILIVAIKNQVGYV